MKPENCSELKDLESGTTPKWTSSPSPPSPTLWGVPLKYLSLVILAVHSSVLTLLMHSSRYIPAAASESESRPYSGATAVLTSEVLKGVISLAIAFYSVDASTDTSATTPGSSLSSYHLGHLTPVHRDRSSLWHEVFSPDCWKMSVPAALYVLQNHLQYIAASNLPAAIFQVTYQMKILITAVFSAILLRKRLSLTQWLSLLFLAIGVGIVQIQAGVQALAYLGSGPSLVKLGSGSSTSPLKGLSAVTAACFTSWLAGVYFETMFKNSKSDLWVRDVQLSFFSIVPALLPVIFSYRSQAMETPEATLVETLFYNFTPLAWATILVQVIGGLITAVVIRYADNGLKGFAINLSIILSIVASVALFHFRVSGTFMLGSSIVLASIYLYTKPSRSTLQAPSHLNHHKQNAKSSEKVKEEAEPPSLPAPLAEALTSQFESAPSFSTFAATHPPETQPTDITEASPECHV
ncbi:hypothetical protein EST38_g12645 [Candolleomyces aberdarensis]|uniref:UDP-galactose transporter n=1 Tax=Candolleomyces aberdarensis TaxID=2316362 RepID=A0A4Q2D1X3_9AGAR|nr:hypothetical protein EST38_g12645 [Candolleomyces aberdarensis]